MSEKPEITGNGVWKPRAFSRMKKWQGAVVREVYHHGIIVEPKKGEKK